MVGRGQPSSVIPIIATPSPRLDQRSVLASFSSGETFSMLSNPLAAASLTLCRHGVATGCRAVGLELSLGQSLGPATDLAIKAQLLGPAEDPKTGPG